VGKARKEWDRSRVHDYDDPGGRHAERMDREESARVGFVIGPRRGILPVAAAWLIQTCEAGWASSAATEATEAPEATKHEHDDSWTT
jgi:hypothetical protein